MSAILNLPSWNQPFWTKKNFTHSFSLNLMMAAILNSTILDSAILHKKNFTHSFWLNLMMAAILNSAMLDSATAILDWDTLLSSLRFTQKHSHSTLTLTQTNSIWFKLMMAFSSWIWWPWIQPFCTKLWLKLNFAILDSAFGLVFLSQTHDVTILNDLGSSIQPFWTKKNFTHSFWLNLMMAAILNSAILDSDTAILDWDTLLSSLSHSLKNTLIPLWLWLKLIQSDWIWWWHSILNLSQIHQKSLSHFAQNSDSN